MTPTFPFGQPVTPVRPRRAQVNELFVLGAYPSALHVLWQPDPGLRIQALPVDNEPTSFWTGDDCLEQVNNWKSTVGWQAEWGHVAAAGKAFNGSSGRSVRVDVMEPLGSSLDRAWVTDCLDLYRMSSGVGKRLGDDVGARLGTIGRSATGLLPHPSEQQIVGEALAHHRKRIAGELEQSGASLLVTLGNAALRVLADLLGLSAIQKLTPDQSVYGRPVRAQFGGRDVVWYPVCHPGQRKPEYRSAHAAWKATVARS
jgi:hypothetical protein